MSKKYKIGYTQGTFDMFHVGHLNLLRKAKELCDHLIVGVNTDTLVEQYKHKTPIINETDRAEIIRSIRYVDDVITVNTLCKTEMLNQCHFDCIFIGDDWKGDERWQQTEKDLAQFGVDVVYLEYTKGVSSSIIRQKIDKENILGG